jgi:hypothetical protein
MVDYTIKVKCGANGKVSPEGSVKVLEGADQEFKIAPEAEYKLDKILVDGVDAHGEADLYKFRKVTANHTLDVTFKSVSSDDLADKDYDSQGKRKVSRQKVNDYDPADKADDYDDDRDPADQKYTIDVTYGDNGTVSPEGSVEVGKGAEQIFKIAPEAEYKLDKILVDGEEAHGESDIYKFKKVTADHTLDVTFKLKYP